MKASASSDLYGLFSVVMLGLDCNVNATGDMYLHIVFWKSSYILGSGTTQTV